MSSFDLLHPALQHHIANSLGWRRLRPFQEQMIPPLLAGTHALVLAPTAGGKTEAAFFPLLSRMLSENWTGLSVIYVCPIKALLNNLEIRLHRYGELLGRRVALWHGDVTAGERQRILRDPPDCLLTTPESLELMLVSRKVDRQALFANLQAVVVDEVHAFAGDDRGWHLLSVLERVTRLCGREPQRIGLSATVGNPDELLDWLAGPCEGERLVYRPPTDESTTAEVTLDHVGSLHNAAVVIARLHRGEKRLVFVDSRARAEQLGAELRELGVTTFVTHSSLSREQRRDAEEAFASREDCVIVATSVLELGVDIGDLDRVIQIDAPTSVSSFLQRMGRTGRRGDAARNCLYLTTTDNALLQAAGLIRLWSEGFVEPVAPPQRPLHIFCQQLMALALQEGGITRVDWPRWIGRVPAFFSLSSKECDAVIDWMVAQGIFFDESGVLWFGPEGERAFGRRNFMELLSVFTSPPLFRILHGRRELGFVDETSFLAKDPGERILLLGGQPWRVTRIDWPRRLAHVEVTQGEGRSRWLGEGPGLSFELAQAVKRTLLDDAEPNCWSRRATAAMATARAEFTGMDAHGAKLDVTESGKLVWWTFAGYRANATLCGSLAEVGVTEATHDSLSITLANLPYPIDELMVSLRDLATESLKPEVNAKAVEGLKFSQCLPPELALGVLRSRLTDEPHARGVLEGTVGTCTGRGKPPGHDATERGEATRKTADEASRADQQP